MAKAKGLNQTGLDKIPKEDRPDSIKVTEWTGELKPKGYKTCSACGVFVRGMQKKECPACKADISPAPKDKSKATSPRKASTSGYGAIVPDDIRAAQELVQTIGGGKVEKALKVLENITSIGDIDRTFKAIQRLKEIEEMGDVEQFLAMMEKMQS